MRIDPAGTVAGYPALVVRRALRRLQFHSNWDQAAAAVAAGVPATQGRRFADAMVAAGLAESAGTAQWNITQLGKRLTSATAARPITRATAERVLREFMCRVEVVNRNDYYLGKVAAVVVFGSMLSPTVDRLSDLDVAVEVVPKESDPARASAANERRASKLERNGYRFRNVIDRHVCWYGEVITFLKSRSRVISLANLRAEGELILSVPHRVVYAEPEWKPYTPPEFQPSSVPNDPDCPF